MEGTGFSRAISYEHAPAAISSFTFEAWQKNGFALQAGGAKTTVAKGKGKGKHKDGKGEKGETGEKGKSGKDKGKNKGKGKEKKSKGKSKSKSPEKAKAPQAAIVAEVVVEAGGGVAVQVSRPHGPVAVGEVELHERVANSRFSALFTADPRLVHGRFNEDRQMQNRQSSRLCL